MVLGWLVGYGGSGGGGALWKTLGAQMKETAEKAWRALSFASLKGKERKKKRKEKKKKSNSSSCMDGWTEERREGGKAQQHTRTI